MEIIYEYILKLLLAVILGGVVGLEREKYHKPAGLRTHMLVAVGSALLTIVALSNFVDDSARIISGIVTGIGFIGAGTIIAQGAKGIHGLTTAATLWAISAIGICVGVGMYALALSVTGVIVLVLFLGKLEKSAK
ncbi:MAG: MgtC/SapB family protein [Nanoarchaeota archaeon]|nr:MgtC/SapB family protein [Nanoarchaeota archaeon]